MIIAAIVALVLVVAGGVTALVLALPGGSDHRTHPARAATSPTVSTTPTPTADPTTVTEADRTSATSFVASALPTVLGYTPGSYDAHVRASLALMTSTYAAHYRSTMSQIRSTVISHNATVTAQTTGTGLRGIGPAGADVLAFVQQTAQRGGGAPTVTSSWATVSLVRSGSGWLIDDLLTTASPAAPAEPDPARNAVLATARQVTKALLQFDYRTVDRSSRRVLALSTGRFAQQYRSSQADLSKLMVEQHTVQTVALDAVGLSRFSPGTAEVLVAATCAVSGKSITGRQVRINRLRITLVRVGEAWRAADVTYVS